MSLQSTTRSSHCQTSRRSCGSWHVAGSQGRGGDLRLQRSGPVPHLLRLRRATGPHTRPASAHRCRGSREAQPLDQAHLPWECSCIPLVMCTSGTALRSRPRDVECRSVQVIAPVVHKTSFEHLRRPPELHLLLAGCKAFERGRTRDFTRGPLKGRPRSLWAPAPDGAAPELEGSPAGQDRFARSREGATLFTR